MTDPIPERRASDGAILEALAEVKTQLGENSEATRGLASAIDGLGRVTEMAARTARSAADQSTETATLMVHTSEHAEEERNKLTERIRTEASAAKTLAKTEVAQAKRRLFRIWTAVAATLTVLVVIGGLAIVRHSASMADEQNDRAAALLQQRNQIARTSCETRNASSIAGGEKLDRFFLGLEAIERRNTANPDLAGDRIAVYERARQDFGRSAPLPNCAALYPNTHP